MFGTYLSIMIVCEVLALTIKDEDGGTLFNLQVFDTFNVIGKVMALVLLVFAICKIRTLIKQTRAVSSRHAR